MKYDCISSPLHPYNVPVSPPQKIDSQLPGPPHCVQLVLPMSTWVWGQSTEHGIISVVTLSPATINCQ